MSFKHVWCEAARDKAFKLALDLIFVLLKRDNNKIVIHEVKDVATETPHY